jgi:hypothetical protein
MNESVENLMQLLSQNKEIPFVDRVINPQNYPAPSIFDDSGRMQTHFMSATPDKDGNWYVYPNIVFENNEYKKLNLNEDQALEYAKSSGNFISFGKDKDRAINFSKNYKPESFKNYYKGLLQE